MKEFTKDNYLDYMASIGDDDLLVVFEECQSCRETGILSSGKARQIMNRWMELSGGNNFTPMVIMQEISNEMAKRYYKMKTSS